MQDFRMNRRTLLGGAVAGGAMLSFAGSAIARQAAVPGATGEVFPFPTHIRDLPNGLRVIVVQTGFPDIVSVQIPVSVGSRNEVEPGKSGFAHFFEHMMFRGTPTLPSSEYQAILKSIGADSNAYTSDDLTNYHTTFNKEDLETVIRIEADRFQNLSYSEPDFRTEARAVLGEYNKNIANPISKLLEVQRAAAFKVHTYKHTTMGFIQDIEAMPDQFEYSRQFFARYYRPNYTSVIIAGDVEPNAAFALVEKYWGGWQGSAETPAPIPAEPAPQGPLYAHVPWATETLPWVTVGFRGPQSAYPGPNNPDSGDQQILDIIGSYAFSESSPLFQRLVLREQKVEFVTTYFPDRVDAGLSTVLAQPKKAEDMAYIRDALQAELANLRAVPADPTRLDAIRQALKYGFAAGLDNTESVASALPGSVAATRDPKTINEIFRRYDSVTPEDIQRVANKYFTDQRMITTTLCQGEAPADVAAPGSVDERLAAISPAAGPAAASAAVKPVRRTITPMLDKPAFKELLQPTASPLMDLRLLFRAGAANDPAGKAGLATLTASMVANAGSKAMTYEQIQLALYPMAAGFGASVDKEMTVFAGKVHRDNAAAWYDIIAGQLLEPGFREEDFTRVKTSLINGIRVGLRANNDEELANEVFYEQIYARHPYGHLNAGHVGSIEKLTLDDVRAFHRQHYTQANLTLGAAGALNDGFLARARGDLSKHLPAGSGEPARVSFAQASEGFHVSLIQKETRAAAITMGFPIGVRRGHPDFVALNLVRSYFGEHRSSASYLYQRIREIRGMNYGDYAYVEYFPGGMYSFQPPANVARSQQAFRIWLRPVPPEHAHFTMRVARYELDKLVRDGMSQADFVATRKFLEKSTGLLTASQGARLGYTLDQQFYGLEDYTAYIKKGLRTLTLAKVNEAIKRHLTPKSMTVAVVTPKAEELKAALLADAPSPMTYASEKPAEIVAEDQIIAVYPMKVDAAKLRVIPVGEVFEKSVFG